MDDFAKNGYPTPPSTGYSSPGNSRYSTGPSPNGAPPRMARKEPPSAGQGPISPVEHDNVLPTLSTQEQMKQLDIIDQLADLGLDHEGVDLPRLVVCGDQSSGKSSVLAAITGIPFPRQAGTCTRFVTQIILRHDANRFTSQVSIEPGRDREASDQKRLKAFRANISSDFSNLPVIVDDAGKAIFTQATQRHEFAEDVLKIEICGKDQQPLEILDLPGLINNDLRGGKDVAAVEGIVKNHISKRRSIVLVVVGADKDLRGHSILQLVKQIPDCRDRTFGIITKPDVPRVQNLDTYLNLASNKVPGYEFEWGWHVLRNSTDVELSAQETSQRRDEKEKEFFYTSAWKQIIRQKPYDSVDQVVGIEALRKRVRELLFQLNQKELPNVRRDILKHLAAHESRLKELGGERDPVQMKQRLVNGCGRLAHMAQDYSRGVYDSIVGDSHDEDLQLRSRIRDLSDEFTWAIHNYGHTFAPDHFPLTMEGDIDTPTNQVGIQRGGAKGKQRQSPDLFDPPKQVSQQRFYADGLDFLSKSRGIELNTYFDPQRISPLFQRQSSKWAAISEHYLREFYDKCEVFLEHALRLEFKTEEDVPSRLWERFLSANVESRKAAAQEELEKLLVDRKRPVKTYSTDFLTRTRGLRSARTYAGFNNAVGNEARRKVNGDDDRRGGRGGVIDPETVSRDFGVFTAGQHEEAEAARFQDDMLTYYVLARTLFVDNFLTQVVERHLLHQMSQLFDHVHSLSDDEAEEILREREDHRLERMDLVNKIKRLKEASRILN